MSEVADKLGLFKDLQIPHYCLHLLKMDTAQTNQDIKGLRSHSALPHKVSTMIQVPLVNWRDNRPDFVAEAVQNLSDLLQIK